MPDKKVFKNPHNTAGLDHAQVPFWFLNDDLQPDELRRQLALMRDAGVKSAILHARSGFIGDYLDDKWFADIGAVVEDQRAHGGQVWLYDEFNWPSGTCNQTLTRDEDLREQYLEFSTLRLQPGEAYERNGHSTGAVSICAFEEGREEPESLLGERAFNIGYTSVGGADIVEVRVKIDPYRSGGAESINYLDARATRAFLDSTHEHYLERFGGDFGKTIHAFFNDETRLVNAYPWCDGFAEAFKARKGYDILPLLGCLVREGDFAGRVRCDYFDTVAHLYQTQYFKVIDDWCREHGVATVAHLLGEETLAGQVRYSGDYMRQTRYLQWPGIDHLGPGIGSHNAKFGASAARNYGRENLSCEVYAGCGWDMSYETFVRMATWLMQQGVQVIINHGFFYSDREERRGDWPPSQFFQWKHWDRMPEYNAMVRRLNHCLSGGRWECEALLYLPLESFWLHYQSDTAFKHGYFEKGPKIQNERAAFIDRQLQLVMSGLQDANVDFNVLNSDALENFEVREGRIHNKLNGESYPVLVLPLAEAAPLPLLELAQRLAAQGGRVIALDCLPRLATRREDDARLAEIVREMAGTGQLPLLPVQDIAGLAATITAAAPPPVEIIEGVKTGRHTAPCYGDVIADPYLHGDASLGDFTIPATLPGGEDLEGVAFTRYIKDGKRITCFANYNAAPEDITVRVQTGETPEVWDPVTGEIAPVQVAAQRCGECDVRLRLPPGQAVLLVAGL